MPSSFPRAQELRYFFQDRLYNLVEAVQNTVYRNPIRYVPKEIAYISENIARFGKPVVVEKHAIQENDTKEWRVDSP